MGFMNIIKSHMVASLYFHFKWLLKKKEIELEKAREELQKCKDEIKKGKPKNSDVPDSVAGILTASDQTDWHRIKYFEKNDTHTSIS